MEDRLDEVDGTAVENGAAAMAAATDVLVVDDDPKNLTAIEAALGDLGGRIVTTRSGAAALKVLLENDFAVILLDVQMPGMDGFETARLIRGRKRTQAIPIIFVTAFNQHDRDIRRGYELGAVDYLFKPIVPEILRSKVNVFVELRRRTAQLVHQTQRLHSLERLEGERRLEQERLRWRMEEQERLNRRLEEADRRKDEFIAVLAHELRNPLAPLVTSLELIKNGTLSKELFEQVRGAMDRQVRHLTHLVDDLLDASRITQGKIQLAQELIDLGDVVEQAVESCRPIIDGRSHTLELTRGEGRIPILADQVRVTQVVTNLVTNAARYTQAGGKITVHVSKDGDAGLLRVLDTGAGIPPELLERIFDMFVQQKDGGQGLGLGLTLVKQLVELHGGSVEAKSDGRGKGSEFSVRIPLSTAEARERPVAETGEHDAFDSVSRRIVVVEDDEDIRTTVRLLLENWGHEVEVAGDGIIGLELVMRRRPEVVILDLGLPGLDGFGVAREIQERLSEDCPRLIAISGLGRATDRERTKKAGFCAHLTKPAEPITLRRLLRDID